MADQDNLDLGPETQDFDDSEFALDLEPRGIDDDDDVYLDLEPWYIDDDFGYDPYTGGPEVDEWGFGPEYYLDEFDY